MSCYSKDKINGKQVKASIKYLWRILIISEWFIICARVQNSKNARYYVFVLLINHWGWKHVRCGMWRTVMMCFSSLMTVEEWKETATTTKLLSSSQKGKTDKWNERKPNDCSVGCIGDSDGENQWKWGNWGGEQNVIIIEGGFVMQKFVRFCCFFCRNIFLMLGFSHYMYKNRIQFTPEMGNGFNLIANKNHSGFFFIIFWFCPVEIGERDFFWSST